MAKTVYGPNNEPHDFPDDMSDDDIVGVMKKTYGGPKEAAKPANPYREAVSRFESAQTPEDRDVLRKEISALDPGDYKGLNSTWQIDKFDKEKQRIEANEGYYGRRAQAGLTFNWADELVAGVDTLKDGVKATMDKPGGSFGWRDRFNENQAVEEALNRKTEAETAGVGGFAAEVAGGIALPFGFIAKGGQAAKATATTGYQGFKEGVKNFFTKPNLAAAAKTGAVVGGIDAAGRSEGGLAERAVDGAKGMAVGAAVAPVIGAGLAGGVGAYAGRQAGKLDKAIEATGEVLSQRGAGLAGDFGPTITDSSAAKWAAPRMANSLFGGKLRERAKQEVDQTLGAAQKLFARESQGRSASELGEEIQDTIRDSFMKQGKPGENPAALGDGELVMRADAVEPSLFHPNGNIRWNPKEAAKVDPTPVRDVPLQAPNREMFRAEKEIIKPNDPKPNLLPREHFDGVVDDFMENARRGMQSVKIKIDAETPKHNAALQARDDAAQRVKGFLLAESKNAPVQSLPDGFKSLSPDRVLKAAGETGQWDGEQLRRAMTEDQWSRFLRANDSYARANEAAEASIANIDKLNSQLSELSGSVSKRRDALYDQHVADETKRAVTEASDLDMLARIQQSEAKAQRDAQERTARMRQDAAKDAETDTARRQAQQQADLERQDALRRRERLHGQGRTYRDEEAAAYEMAGRMIPQGATANPLGRSHVSGDGPVRTGVTDLLNEFAADAKLKLLHRGYKGEVFGNDGVGLNPIFENYLRGKLGSDVADPLASYAALRNDMLPHARKKLDAQEKRLAEVQDRRGAMEQDRAKADLEAQAVLKDSPRLTDEEAETAMMMWDFVKSAQRSKPQTLSQWVIEKGGVKDFGGDVKFMTGDKKIDRRMIKAGGNNLDDMALRAWEAGFITSKERPSINQFLDALDDDLRGNMIVRGSDVEKLETLRVADQMREELGRLGIDGSKGHREQVKGWLTGKWSGEQQHQMKLEAVKNQEDEILAAIGKIKEDGKATQFDVQTLHDFRSQVRRLKDDVSYSKKVPGQLRTEDEAMLSRLDATLTKEISRIKQDLGPEGIQADRFRKSVDQAYAERVETMRKPLETLFKGKVEPLQALDRLVAGAQRGDDRMIRAYMRIVTETGDSPMRASSAIIQHATKNANSLDEFMKGASSVPKHIRDILFSGKEGQQYLKDLDVLVKHGEKLLPFSRSLRSEREGGAQAGEIVARVGSAALTHGIGYGAGGVYTVVAQMAGTALASRMMASPKYVNWLTKFPRGKDFNPSSAATRQHINKLSALAAEDDDDVMFEAITKGLKELIPSVKPAAAMMVGENARGIDKQILARAKAMDADGKDRDAIWKSTGWYKDGDGKWRMEIDDSDADVTDDYHAAVGDYREDGKTRVAKLSDLLSHRKLFEAYPKLGKTTVTVGKMPKGLEAARGAMNSQYGAMFMNGDTRDVPHISTMLHEGQHGVDSSAGFDYGQQGKRGSELIKDEGRYFRMPGEVQAYNVENRRTMSAEERWAQPPWDTQPAPEGGLLWSRNKNKQVATAEARKARPEAKQEVVEAPDLFTTLEQPPTLDEARGAIAKGVKNFDIDIRNADPRSIAEIKKAGGKITAYHVGGGGGRAWKGLSPDEQVNKFDTEEGLAKLTADTKDLVSKGADNIHFDNTHRMSGKKLEQVADAILAGGAGFVAKNNASKWNLVMRRRPDLKPAYAVIEAAMHDEDETQAAADLAQRGVPVYVIGFKKPLEAKEQGVTAEYAAEYRKRNPWAHVILMEDEKAYEGRTATSFKGSK